MRYRNQSWHQSVFSQVVEFHRALLLVLYFLIRFHLILLVNALDVYCFIYGGSTIFVPHLFKLVRLKKGLKFKLLAMWVLWQAAWTGPLDCICAVGAFWSISNTIIWPIINCCEVNWTKRQLGSIFVWNSRILFDVTAAKTRILYEHYFEAIKCSHTALQLHL